MGEKMETGASLISLGSKITADDDYSHELEEAHFLEEKLWQTYTAY